MSPRDPAREQVIAMRPFVPAKDMALSRAFYEALGFVADPIDERLVLMTLSANSDPARTFGFLLQDHYVREWAENSMIHVFLDRIAPWWDRVAALDLSGRFGVQPPAPPRPQPWGLTVAYVWDPAGVLWHFTERTAEQP